MTGTRQLAAPGKQLVMQWDPHRADIGTGSTQAARMGQLRVGGGVSARFEDRADGPGDRRRIAMSAAASVDGAGVETRTAANAAKRFSKSRAAEKLASTIVDDHDMEFLRLPGFGRVLGRAGAWPAEMRGVGRDGLSGR